MNPSGIKTLLEGAGVTTVLGLVIWAALNRKIVAGWMFDLILKDRDEYKEKYLNKVDPKDK